ncbi:unnamed protein product [Brugia timori]|uniref:Uncharacterized protein n=1 Tax=Brugia timori TaxID=42155 RepID=A0A3P7SZZ3_9BILA|nr:unnamed protein product [Brugia timori]
MVNFSVGLTTFTDCIVYFLLSCSHRLFSLSNTIRKSGFANFLIKYAKITAVGIVTVASNLSILIKTGIFGPPSSGMSF